MKRFLLLALTAGLLSPIAVKAESEFTELPEPSPQVPAYKPWGGYQNPYSNPY